MDLINPFEPVSKAATVRGATVPAQSATIVRALVRTGGAIGHGQDLHVTRRHGGGGRRAGLEHYRGKGIKALVGKSAKREAVERGLAMTGRYAPTSVPRTAAQSRQIGHTGRMGRADQAIAQLRSKLNFGDGASRGRRVP